MEEILSAFGIDWKLISIQVFNFTILAVLLWYFLYTPVLNLLNEREAKIKKGIEDAKEAARAREQADTERLSILSAAEKEAETRVERSSQIAKEKAETIIKDAEDRASGILEDAEAKAEVERERVRRESEAEIAKLAVLAAERVLRKENA